MLRQDTSTVSSVSSVVESFIRRHAHTQCDLSTVARIRNVGLFTIPSTIDDHR